MALVTNLHIIILNHNLDFGFFKILPPCILCKYAVVHKSASVILLSAEGIIITGGGGGSAGITSVEVLLRNDTLCTLPPLPEGRSRHSQSGLTACGGKGHGSPALTCTTLSNGAWTTSHNLDPARRNHISWNSPSGLMLLGGGYSKGTTSLLSSSSSSVSDQFELPYDTR